ncbi:MAG: dTDP-glucose 4,6-dehydratase [Lentisphaerae bacterium GWF2_45_14]|nr:MAG: dTDP-glucose 4,6-dehydratase [Lentisphaerae bacterium GWF2_45_14]
MSEKIIVLGSNSFSGSHFVNHCLDEGMNVVGISRSPEPEPVFLPYKSNASIHNFTFCQLDLNRDIDGIENRMMKFKPDYVINFAAQGMVAQSWEAPGQWLMTNAVSAIELHDRLRKCGFLKKFVQVSTPEVYGSCEGLVKESTSYCPSTPYAVSKAAADMSLMTFLKTYKFPVVFTRAANVYGPGQQLYRIIPITILKFLSGEKLQLHGGGHSVRSFIHIRDVVRGTLKAARSGNPGDIFHFSTARNISIRQLVEKIAGLMNVDFNKHVKTVRDRLGKDSAYILDSQKAADELGWHCNVSLDDGLRETIEWVTDNFDTLRYLPEKYIHKA